MKTAQRPRELDPNTVWKLYHWFANGLTVKDTADKMGISPVTISIWTKKYSYVRKIRKYAARTHKRLLLKGNYKSSKEQISLLKTGVSGDKDDALKDFIYGELSPELRGIWEKTVGLLDTGNSSHLLDELLNVHPKKVRQALFLHAWFTNNFNATRAAQICRLEPHTVHTWKRSDPEFRALAAGMLNVMKDKITGAVFSLVDMLEPATVRFAAERLVPEKFGPPKQQIEMQGSIDMNQRTFEYGLKELEPFLSTQCKVELLEAVNKFKSKQLEQRREENEAIDV